MNNPLTTQDQQSPINVRKSLEIFHDDLREKFDAHYKLKETTDRNGVVSKPFILKPPGANNLRSSLPSDGRLKNLRPQHLNIIGLYLSGKYKVHEIATIVKSSVPFVQGVIKSKPAQKMITDSYHDSVGEFQTLTKQAVDAFRKGLDSSDLQVRMKAANDYFKIIQRQSPKKIDISIEDNRQVDVKGKLFSKLGLDPTKLIELSDVEYEQS